MKAIILAGGFATRLWPLTEKRAKPLLILKNKPLISHITENIPESIEIIISTNQIFEKDFLQWKEKNFPKRKITIFIEDSNSDKTKKGALGAVSLVIQEMQIKDDLIIIAGDNYFGFDFKDFLKSYHQNPLLAVFDIKDLKKARQFGVVISSDQKTITAFQEKPLHPKSTLVSTGAYIFPQKNLTDIIYYSQKYHDDLGGIFEYLKTKNTTINIFSFQEPWFDIGSFSGYLEAHKSLSANKNKQVTIKNTELSGAISLASDCVLENCLLDNVIVFPKTKIKNCEIRNCIIDQNCLIDGVDLSYKIIRENSFIK